MTKAEQARVAIESSGIHDLFISTGFVAVVIFFILNGDYFTVMDIMLGSIFTLFILKSIYFLMVSFIILLTDVEMVEEDIKFKNSIDRIDTALSELMIQETKKSLKKS